jgi:radical SAM superfamily enzyme YgiQ (UPF0313 family)
MDVTLIIKSVTGLVVLLGLLVFLLFLPSRKKKKVLTKKVDKADKKISQAELKTDFPFLLSVIKNKKTSAEKLKEALDLVIKYHGTVHKKLGLRPHPDFDRYMDILFTICRHPNTNKNIIVGFDTALEKLNPEYKKEINDAIAKGLNSRGI